MEYKLGPLIRLFHSASFCYNTDEMTNELNFCLYRLAYGNIVTLIVMSLHLKVAEPVNVVKVRTYYIPKINENMSTQNLYTNVHSIISHNN